MEFEVDRLIVRPICFCRSYDTMNHLKSTGKCIGSTRAILQNAVKKALMIFIVIKMGIIQYSDHSKPYLETSVYELQCSTNQ